MDKPTFVRFVDDGGELYVNVSEIVTMCPGDEHNTTYIQTTQADVTYEVKGSFAENMNKLKDVIY